MEGSPEKALGFTLEEEEEEEVAGGIGKDRGEGTHFV